MKKNCRFSAFISKLIPLLLIGGAICLIATEGDEAPLGDLALAHSIGLVLLFIGGRAAMKVTDPQDTSAEME